MLPKPSIAAVRGLFGSFSHYVYGAFIFPEKPQGGGLGKFVRNVHARGVAHNHLFIVTIGYKGFTTVTAEHISLFCHAASIPALNVMTSPYREGEAHYEVPYGISYEPITLHFYGDVKLVIKTMFDRWYHSITQSRTMQFGQRKNNNRLKFMDDITADISISILNKEEDVVYTVILKNAWPKSIGNIDLSAQNTDVVSFPVQFVYERLEMGVLEGKGPEAGKPLTPKSFPMNIFTSAANTAGSLLTAATGFAGSAVRGILGGASTVVNEAVDGIRSKVTNTPADGAVKEITFV